MFYSFDSDSKLFLLRLGSKDKFIIVSQPILSSIDFINNCQHHIIVAITVNDVATNVFKQFNVNISPAFSIPLENTNSCKIISIQVTLFDEHSISDFIISISGIIRHTGSLTDTNWTIFLYYNETTGDIYLINLDSNSMGTINKSLQVKQCTGYNKVELDTTNNF